ESSSSLESPPHHLWVQQPGMYVDERGKTWVTVIMQLNYPQEVEPNLTVHLWQLPAQTETFVPHHLSCFSLEPSFWILCSERRYRASDARLWEIVAHTKVASTEQLVLALHRRG
uniref:T cell leukemia/lymphoma 1B n=1 Tax=Otolemur garnettii TaxID=30611 RepID=H0XYA5_OTOGA